MLGLRPYFDLTKRGTARVGHTVMTAHIFSLSAEL
jgi:hypothetical protein